MAKSGANVGQPVSMVDRSVGQALGDYVIQTLGVAAAEVQKLYHDPLELLTRAVQPVLWLMLFGEVMARVRGVAPGNIPYLDFLSAGILAQSALFVAIFYGISAIWEHDLGVLQRYLVSPAPRSALVLGKALSAGVRALSQGLIVYVLALLLGVGISLNPLSILGVAAAIMLGSALFSTLSLIIACIVKTRERFMGIGQVLTMPIFFASNAIYPLSLMPDWLRAVSHANPLTYEVDALRALMLTNGTSDYGLLLDFAVLLAVTAALTAIAARMYGRMGY
ncbi:MAG TPA: ABC transporter permease [Pseudolabrys sp.]|jgi:ABC-2 type transport system permease protein|nr:ABC transporter permease [Pseudolabrys sp.]